MALLDPIVNAPKGQKVGFGVMLLVIVAALGYFLVISPKRLERDDLSAKNEDLRLKVLKAQADEARLRPFRAQVAALRKRLEAAKERLPSEREIPALYRQLSDLTFESGLGLAVFQPKAPEEHEVVTEVPIQVTAEGGYHQLGQFFDRVGRMPRIVALGDFRLVGIDRPTGSLRAELTMATYLFRPEGAPPPKKPGAPPAAPTPPPAPAPGAKPAAPGGR
jgi:type IV pilus assembly protein PilO